MSPAKRAFDVVASAVGLAVLSPLLVGIAVAVRRDGGPALFRQERVGRHGVPFRLLKFRSMVVDAEKLGAQVTVGGDPRVTAVGRWLRKTKLDELPQLINVLRGEMSLVGPRPEVPRYVALYTPEQRRVLDVPPGITDPASIRFRDEEGELAAAEDPHAYYVHVLMPEKLRLNLAYVDEATLLSDLRIIGRTLQAIVAPRAAVRAARREAVPAGR